MKYLLLLLIILASPFVFAEDCTELYEVVDKYYEASKSEDYEKYISLMDVEYITQNLATKDNYATYVKSGFEVYDITSYEINYHKCSITNKEGIVFLNLDYVLRSEGKNYDLKRDYVAVLRETSTGWKIQFVMDLETFAYHQNMIYELWYLNETKDNIIQTANELEETQIYIENLPKQKSNAGKIILYLILILGICYLIYFLFAKKKMHEKIKKHTKKALKHNSKN